MNYVRSNGFGGGMVWAIDLDDVEGYCGERWPLLKAINRVLHCKLHPFLLIFITSLYERAQLLQLTSLFQWMKNLLMSQNLLMSFHLLLQKMSNSPAQVWALLPLQTTAKATFNALVTISQATQENVLLVSISTLTRAFVTGLTMFNAKSLPRITNLRSLMNARKSKLMDFLLTLTIVGPCIGVLQAKRSKLLALPAFSLTL